MGNSTNHTRRQLLKTGGILTTTGLLAGCSGNSTQSSEEQAVKTKVVEKTKIIEKTPEELGPDEWRKEMVSRAKAELQGEKFNWITTQRRPEVVKAWTDAWDQEYPELAGKVNPVQGRTTELAQRYRREVRGDNLTIDVVRAGSTFQQLTAQGFQLGDMREIPAYQEIPDRLKGLPERGVMAITCWLPAMNTELVTQPPETWDDMMANRFAGDKVVVDYTPNPGKAGYILVKLGKDWLKQFGEQQDPRLIKSGYKITKVTADGASHLSLMSNLRHILRFNDKGLPIEPTSPNLARLQRSSVFLPDKPPHPAAAKLFADFLMRPDNQKLQIQRPGSMATDGETVNPPEMKKYFADAQMITPVQAMRKLGVTMDGLIEEYQRAIGAPVV